MRCSVGPRRVRGVAGSCGPVRAARDVTRVVWRGAAGRLRGGPGGRGGCSASWCVATRGAPQNRFGANRNRCVHRGPFRVPLLPPFHSGCSPRGPAQRAATAQLRRSGPPQWRLLCQKRSAPLLSRTADGVALPLPSDSRGRLFDRHPPQPPHSQTAPRRAARRGTRLDALARP